MAKVDFYDGKQHPVDSKDIAFQMAGNEIAIGFNATYLKEAVSKYPSEDIILTFKDANSAVLLLPKENDQKTIILLMPVRINE